MLDRVSPAPTKDPRRILNAHFLTDAGMTDLQDRLHTGCYEVHVPEEGALLIVAWLVDNGFTAEARALLDAIGPYFSRLRFYPVLVDRPRRYGSRVCLQDVGSTIESLNSVTPNRHILAQKEAIQVWAPLYDQAVALFLETVDGDPPCLRRGPDGERLPRDNGKFPVEGGWPCQTYPEGWAERAERLLQECRSKRRNHKLCGRPDRANDSFAPLRDYLRKCIKNPRSLSGRDVGMIRLILARYNAKRGTPNSSRCREVRERQAQQVRAPGFHEIARVIVSRLEPHPKDTGMDDLSPVTQPVTEEEEKQTGIESGMPIPTPLQSKVRRCLSDTVDALVKRGVITSGDTLARLLPQMTSGLRAAGITDPALRHLYAAIYRAFRSRRSLLLLNLESQVKIEELPWVAATDRFRSENLSTRESARQTLEEVAILALVSFPHAILPNKLLQELRALAKGADLPVPLVDEVAADIFMGEFSGKFVRAAKVAADLMGESLYATYYGIDYERIRRLPEKDKAKRSWFRRATSSDPFVELCSSMAGVSYGGWDPAINGMIIEQQQIITTQNLAALFNRLGLVDSLQHDLDDMAKRCFIWVCRRQQMKINEWHGKLIMLKNTAYAWRQMIFFLSLLPRPALDRFLIWADQHLAEQSPEFRRRFGPAFHGLAIAAEGRTPAPPSARGGQTRRFLGWSKEEHWLID